MGVETGLKQKFRRILGGWSETYEPGAGSGVGYPDLQFLVDGILIPIEIKRCWIETRDGSLFLRPSEIRPAQISWHHDFSVAGGASFIVCCLEGEGGISAWALPETTRDVTSKWRKGYDLMDCKCWVRGGQAVIDLPRLAQGIASVSHLRGLAGRRARVY